MKNIRSLSLGVFLWAVAVAVNGQALDIPRGRGIWVQGPVAKPNIANLQSMGVRRVHVMATNDPGKQKDCQHTVSLPPTASPAVLRQAIRSYVDAQIVTVVTFYVLPNRSQIDLLTTKDSGPLAALMAEGLHGVEFDLEGSWAHSTVCGFGSHKEALVYLLEKTRELSPQLKVGITTHLQRADDPRIVSSAADWLAVQAYARCQQKACAPFDDPNEGPGQKELRAAKVTFKGPIILGLSAHAQKWPDKSVLDAMGQSLKSVLALREKDARFVGHSYWSTSWIQGDPGQFLRSSAALVQ